VGLRWCIGHAIGPLHPRLQHHVALQGKAVIAQPLPESVRVATQTQQGRVMGQEAQPSAHIETEDRHRQGCEMAGRPQHGAIPAQHDRQIGQGVLGGEQTRKGIGGEAALGHHHSHTLGSQIILAAAG